MSYYPKSQIKTNQYTNGSELVYKKNSRPYSGYYWINSSGKYFTGKTPQDPPNEELVTSKNIFDTPTASTETQKISSLALSYGDPYIGDDPNLYNESSIISYASLKNISTNSPPITYVPSYFPTLPTQQDYKNGEMMRYFCKKTNEIIYIEISKDTYNKLTQKDPQILWQLYQPFKLLWKISGNINDVISINVGSVALLSAQLNLPMLSEYLKNDFTKYYK